MKNDFYKFLNDFESITGKHDLVESVRAAYIATHPLTEMKQFGEWGDNDPTKRIGKTERNIDAARAKAANPVTVRFHRTESGNVDSIAQNGLKRVNPKAGANTGGRFKDNPLVWTSTNPDSIPVLRRYGANPRYAKGIDTFKITMPKSQYEKTQRCAFPNGRCGNAVPVTGKENSVSYEHHTYPIDAFQEDIPAENLSVMQKNLTPEQIDEVNRFRRWKDGNIGNLPANATWNNVKRGVPRDAAGSSKSLEREAYNMGQVAQYVPKVKSTFDWDKYNSLVSSGVSPSEASKQCAGNGMTNRPWNNTKPLVAPSDYDLANYDGMFNRLRRSGTYSDELISASAAHDFDALKTTIGKIANDVFTAYPNISDDEKEYLMNHWTAFCKNKMR